MGITGLFDIAKSALYVAQQGLTVTGHNVANVNTPGYSKQEVMLSENQPVNLRPGQVGTGVQVTQIRRAVDAFVNRALTDSYESTGRLAVLRNELFRLQSLFADSNNQGLSALLDDFFKALSDVATAPSQSAPRSVLLAKAGTLAGGLRESALSLNQTRLALNAQAKQTIAEINALAAQIADLNGRIVSAEVTGQNANDLRDQRDRVLNDLAQRIAVTTFETSTGAVSVFIGQGLSLVEETTTRSLTAVENLDNGGLADVGYALSGTKTALITSQLSDGKLYGLLHVRDAVIPDLQRRLDTLAAALINEVNQVHRLGYGLDGSTGVDFFVPFSVTTAGKSANAGTGAIGNGTVAANSLLTFHDYEIRFSSPTTYSLVDSSTGAFVRGNYTGTVVTPPTPETPISIVTGTNDTLTVAVDGVASGTITLAGAGSPGRPYTSGADLASELQSKINADAALSAAGKSVIVTYDPTTNRFVITSNSADAASHVDVTGGTARAVLGLLSGTSTAASGTYSGPQNFVVDGLAVTVTGVPAAGDAFTFNSRTDAAKHFTVSLTNGRQVAASSTLAGLPGNNANLLALAALQEKPLAGLDGVTFNEAYRQAAADLGVAAQAADREFQARSFVQEQLQTFRAQVSGVSIDEELVAMLKYQRAFDAAAKLIVVADEMLQTLLALKR
ncbi:MAG TPA: flagellar hook-associated protein FlgK [Nitrospiraceae bacterium]|jgi:flagellar hook-associated protein 1 FlgK|nr:flagellar hook-associated protein FlgK [Nitrospiraceae bacterium]